MIQQLEQLWTQGLTSEFGHWLEQRMAYVGQPVTWDEQGKPCSGQCLGLNHPGHAGHLPQTSGGLLVKLPDGVIRVLVGHEVDHLAKS